MRIDKLIVTNRKALQRKYGVTGMALVDQALAALVAADAARGMATRIAGIDSASDMAGTQVPPVATRSGQRAAKAAVDGLYKRHTPDYLVILGGPDVIPHIDLYNPLLPASGASATDDDAKVPSDLPYACDGPWTRDPGAFLGPTRVVGRIPDDPEARKPDLLIAILARAADHQSRDRGDFESCFALSAEIWKKSTRLSIGKLFGPGKRIATSPKEGPNWTKARLAPRMHFINCHGQTVDPAFYGEGSRGGMPVAHLASGLLARVTEGTVVAAECCYGAELYPSSFTDDQAGIALTYLSQGAAGYFGSSCIAYGPAEGNGQADIVCQFFLRAVLGGASLGRAALEARQQYVAQFSHLDPFDLKTLAQFMLLGDPSLHPVKHPTLSQPLGKTLSQARARKVFEPGTRSLRRERLERTGSNLARTVGRSVATMAKGFPRIEALLRADARELGIRITKHGQFRLSFPEAATGPLAKSIRKARTGRTLQVVFGAVGVKARDRPRRRAAIIATLEGETIIHVRHLFSK